MDLIVHLKNTYVQITQVVTIVVNNKTRPNGDKQLKILYT